ncbi:hypothetical protein A7K93_08100 [Candidatus Methylacidiphilum fumarolicum]|uniref:O-antigen ligase domain-containing protein n=3 Tax=Candidatus Methylacidiphilum fumarolicum TaxID=591154 RepID=I0JYD0_METFB|nr:hypothetical protein [Candidatus Methylacidiphilum fumarolicum]CCG92249.1 conserved membrane hypothetical protein [Methylacidiphilum fumariolicum SolV]TFE67256.1 hypothetical protein A7K73_09345 [Candidatus Methylacidiphilum fumarolicum]TFE71769.1 hypothetical protein A7K72_10165 [Candidatus Methylacidiphilum fumarolicum]TFE72751.1 hypothetical protein A7K93_08100 [Candidatus Methylacidiphilum fumarolicum]TFE76257.1 hypothetical protein A7D33_10535 [Candidatus Methylacidiphilum fumarolicum]
MYFKKSYLKNPPCNPQFLGKKKQLLTRILIIIYVLLLTEGILRKWIFPEFGRVLFFIRDPFVIWAYWLGLRLNLWSRPHPLFLGGLSFAIIALLLAVYEAFFEEISPVFIFYGFRNYFLYIPLPFLMERALSKEQLDKVAKWTLLYSIPMAPLCFLQTISPSDSPINAGFAQDPELAYKNLGVYGEIQRASGTFTFVLGLSLFIASCLGFFIYLLFKNKNQKFLKGFLTWIVGGAVLVNILVSGSRMAFILCFLVLVGSLIAGLRSGLIKQSINFIIVLVIMAIVSVFFSLTIFSNIVGAMQERWTGASENEGGYLMLERIAGDLIRFIDVMDNVPFLGFGIGTAGNAYTILQGEQSLYVEDDWSRNIYELGPLFGLLYLAYRFSLVIYLGLRCWKATAILKNPLPLILYSFVGPILFNGQITSQGTANGYGWIFTGFCLVASRIIPTSSPERPYNTLFRTML